MPVSCGLRPSRWRPPVSRRLPSLPLTSLTATTTGSKSPLGLPQGLDVLPGRPSSSSPPPPAVEAPHDHLWLLLQVRDEVGEERSPPAPEKGEGTCEDPREMPPLNLWPPSSSSASPHRSSFRRPHRALHRQQPRAHRVLPSVHGHPRREIAFVRTTGPLPSSPPPGLPWPSGGLLQLPTIAAGAVSLPSPCPPPPAVSGACAAFTRPRPHCLRPLAPYSLPPSAFSPPSSVSTGRWCLLRPPPSPGPPPPVVISSISGRSGNLRGRRKGCGGRRVPSSGRLHPLRLPAHPPWSPGSALAADDPASAVPGATSPGSSLHPIRTTAAEFPAAVRGPLRRPSHLLRLPSPPNAVRGHRLSARVRCRSWLSSFSLGRPPHRATGEASELPPPRA